MRLTPIEIRQHRFNTRFRGHDPDEVNAFLEMVVSDFEDVVRENVHLRREAERLARELDGYRGREETIQKTLTTAQGVVEHIKRTATKEAEIAVQEAELRAEKLVRDAELRRAGLTREVGELRHMRDRVENDLRKTLEGYLALIDAYRDARQARPGSRPSPATPARPPNPTAPAARS